MAEDAAQPELPQIPTTSNPKEFLDLFRNSKFYHQAYDEFFQGKKLAPDVTPPEKDQVFLESELAKHALIDFGTKELKLTFDPRRYPEESQKAISEYGQVAKDMTKMIKEGASTDEIISADQTKFHLHGLAATQLVKDNIVPTARIGKALCGLILIDLGLDTAEGAREPDVTRIRRRLGMVD